MINIKDLDFKIKIVPSTSVYAKHKVKSVESSFISLHFFCITIVRVHGYYSDDSKCYELMFSLNGTNEPVDISTLFFKDFLERVKGLEPSQASLLGITEEEATEAINKVEELDLNIFDYITAVGDNESRIFITSKLVH